MTGKTEQRYNAEVLDSQNKLHVCLYLDNRILKKIVNESRNDEITRHTRMMLRKKKQTIIIERLKQTENYLWLQRYATIDSEEAHLQATFADIRLIMTFASQMPR